jgi:ABC-2 type transport system permease protein
MKGSDAVRLAARREFRERVRSRALRASTAVQILIVIAIVVISASSGLARLLTFLPPVAPLVVPGRATQGELPAWELGASLVLMVVGTLLMMMLAVRIYERTVLRMGTPVKLREVLRIRHSG